MSKKSFHLKSMTAYGRGMVDFAYGRLTVEIQSVNRRYLEISVGLPRLLMRYEMDIRSWISSSIGRGMVSVSVNWKNELKRPLSVKPNLPLAHAVKDAWKGIADELGIELNITLDLLSREKDLLLYEEEIEEERIYKEALEKGIFHALSQLIAMKEDEGSRLAADLDLRIISLEKAINEIEKRAPESSEKFRQKLMEKLEELFTKSSDNEERVLREIAVFAEKVDVTEEVIRFKSHLEQFQNMLKKPLEEETETRGKTLDFLIQELNREINTIGSKSSDKMVTQQMIFVKAELEKIREQVQNIE